MRKMLGANDTPLEFIKNVLDVDVDGAREVNTYTVKGMYNKVDPDGFASVVFKPVAKFSLSWQEIEEAGGIAQVNSLIKKRFAIDC